MDHHGARRKHTSSSPFPPTPEGGAGAWGILGGFRQPKRPTSPHLEPMPSGAMDNFAPTPRRSGRPRAVGSVFKIQSMPSKQITQKHDQRRTRKSRACNQPNHKTQIQIIMTHTELFFSILALCFGFWAFGFFHCWLINDIEKHSNDDDDDDDQDFHTLPNCTCDDSTTCDIYCIAKHKFNQDHGFN